MNKYLLATVVCALSSQCIAAMDDSGCESIGITARIFVQRKLAGETYQQQLSVLKRSIKDRHALGDATTLLHQIYFEPWAKHLTPDGAQNAYQADCMAQQSQ